MNLSYVTNNTKAAAICAGLANQKVLGVDIETAPLPAFEGDKRAGLCPYKSQIRLVSVAQQDGAAFVFDMGKVTPAALHPLASVPWVAHNAVFEWRHFTHNGYTLPERLHDTQLMGRPLYHEILSLNNLSKAVTGQELDKELQVSNWGGELSQAQLEYAANDAVVTLQLSANLLPRLNKAGQRPLYDLYRQTVPVVGQQMLGGVYLDWEQHHRLYEQWLQDRDLLKLQLDNLLAGVNPRSAKQLSGWLADNLPSAVAKKWPRTATGNLSSAADSLGLHANLPMVQPLLRYKAAEKLIGTYGKGYERHRNEVTGRLHPDYLIAGTAGGRFACRNPNVQNPPRSADIRALFCAEPGRVLVAADFGQIELRVAALLSQDARMLAAYANGEDLHRVTAAAVSGVPLGQVTAEQRQAAKAINFGNLYQQRPAGLSRYAQSSYGVAMSVQQAATAQQAFFRAYPDLYRWQMVQIQNARIYRKVHTQLGLVRDFDYRCGYEAAEACNHPIQGSAGEILLASMVQLPDQLKGLDAMLVNHVHDEIILSVADNDKEAAAVALEQAMIQGFLDVFPNGEALLPGLVEVKTGANWAETK